ncbi:MAG TPA: PHB depolymerase family esterase [Mucilaginibacter sp.]|nr:PHB depolymerase family esterase [Mucilaginibacter sp.]
MRTILIVFACFLFKLPAVAQQKTDHITVDGLDREFVTYLPAGMNAGDKLPVIISLHGRLGTAVGQMKFADFRPLADRDKFIIVCPQGIDRSWNDGRGTPAHRKGINDVKFISQLIDYIISTYHADGSRVYATGMSNGGFMASRLACELNKRIAAVAIVGASMGKDVGFEPVAAMPVMYIQGTADPLVPFAGGMMKTGAGGSIYGHEEILKKWVSIDRCNDKPVITSLRAKYDDGTSVIKEEYSNKYGVQVVGYAIVGGGHTWPGGKQYLPKAVIGSVSHNLDACEVIWAFFRNFRKTSAG